MPRKASEFPENVAQGAYQRAVYYPLRNDTYIVTEIKARKKRTPGPPPHPHPHPFPIVLPGAGVGGSAARAPFFAPKFLVSGYGRLGGGEAFFLTLTITIPLYVLY